MLLIRKAYKDQVNGDISKPVYMFLMIAMLFLLKLFD